MFTLFSYLSARVFFPQISQFLIFPVQCTGYCYFFADVWCDYAMVM